MTRPRHGKSWLLAAMALLAAAWGTALLWGPMPLAKPLPTTGGTSGEVIQLQEVAAAAALPPLQHRQVQLVGRLRAEYTVLLKGRGMAGQRGLYVLTPLVERGNTGLSVLVLRGWVPNGSPEMVQRILRFTPPHDLVIHGRLALPDLGSAADAAGQSGTIRQALSLPAYASEIGMPLVPMVVLQEAETTTSARDIQADLLKRRWPELYPQDRYRAHQGWAALATALVLAAAALWTWRQRRAQAPVPDETDWESMP